MAVCMRHPRYDGTGSPELSCKTCCSLFIAGIKQRNAAGEPVTESMEETIEWLDQKAPEVVQAAVDPASFAGTNISKMGSKPKSR